MGRLALTFDDGPDPRWTAAVLDALGAAGARATFFVLGPRVREHPGLVRRMLDEGHAVGVHADEHVRHTDLDAEAGDEDLARALRALGEAGVAPALWRTPWGVQAPWTAGLARRRGLRLVGWTADTHDWRGDDAPAMLQAIDGGLRDGAIVLAHDGLGPGSRRADCAQTVALIPAVVARARDLGLAVEALA
ncbi:polysaccharide deacetylase family protein [Baekduia soli]|uniref:Polysaccharide deacetylase family protein n=1 Tax=Baekduia soli TaxID=496014 RepID=A0A5B8U571_9ACTN|nr:polysaccharide deacetylase family protein [Baekduia soli]QEC47792.1 polysaccharide deacetylase family protein [Baekduia soli]